MQQTFGGYSFELVGAIEPSRNELGQIAEELPQSRYLNAGNLKLNSYGHGPYCRFRIARGWRIDGVYVIASGDTPLYVGECQNLEKRYGATGYGRISPRNCFKGGQETNCRINNLILEAKRNGVALALWFHAAAGGKAERVSIEARLKACLHPVWNR